MAEKAVRKPYKMTASIFKSQGLNTRGDRLVSGNWSVFKYYVRISEESYQEREVGCDVVVA